MPEPVFIVGVQRSGTTLLAAMLAAHSRLSCGPETHFFRRLPADPQPLCEPSSWPGPAVEFIRSISHTGFVGDGARTTLLAKYHLDDTDVASFLGQRPPAVSSMLASVTEQHMRRKGKRRWVEKTPDHLRFTETIRRYFPESPIVRIVRDPRDVALSLTRVPWGARSVREGLLYWERLDRESRRFFERDRNSLTIRFEDLVSSPEQTLRLVCEAIGESFEEAMLDTSSTGREINSRNVPWKEKVGHGVDVSRAAAWVAELGRDDNRFAEALLGDRLAHFGYARHEQFDRCGRLVPGPATAARYAEALARLATDGVRFWRLSPDEEPSVTLYLGDPDSESWRGVSSHDTGLLPVLRRIAAAHVSTQEVYWTGAEPAGGGVGWRSRMLRVFLSPHRVPA